MTDRRSPRRKLRVPIALVVSTVIAGASGCGDRHAPVDARARAGDSAPDTPIV